MNQLTGTLPSDMGLFAKLIHLKLDHNQFRGTIPDSWPTGLANGRLQNLYLNDNQLTGTVPDNWMYSNILGKGQP